MRRFAMHFYDRPYYLPSVEAGKYCKKDGRILLPLSIACRHYAATDGVMRGFLEPLQSKANRFEEFVK